MYSIMFICFMFSDRQVQYRQFPEWLVRQSSKSHILWTEKWADGPSISSRILLPEVCHAGLHKRKGLGVRGKFWSNITLTVIGRRFLMFNEDPSTPTATIIVSLVCKQVKSTDYGFKFKKVFVFVFGIIMCHWQILFHGVKCSWPNPFQKKLFAGLNVTLDLFSLNSHIVQINRFFGFSQGYCEEKSENFHRIVN